MAEQAIIKDLGGTMHQHELGDSAEQRLASDLRTFSVAGIERVGWGWRQKQGQTEVFQAAERAALHAIEHETGKVFVFEGSERLGGLVLAVIWGVIVGLARQHAHDVDSVADDVGGSLLSFGACRHQ